MFMVAMVVPAKGCRAPIHRERIDKWTRPAMEPWLVVVAGHGASCNAAASRNAAASLPEMLLPGVAFRGLIAMAHLILAPIIAACCWPVQQVAALLWSMPFHGSSVWVRAWAVVDA